MAAILQEEDDVISEINIIPFVDIVLVLLIIFMVTSTAIVKAALDVELPRAASGGASVPKTLNFVYTVDGELLLDGAAISREAAAARIRETKQVEPEAQAVISADKRLPYGDVIEIIDLVKLNGITSFALNIERVDAP